MIFAHIDCYDGLLHLNLYEEQEPCHADPRASVSAHSIEVIEISDNQFEIHVGGLTIWCDELRLDDLINSIPYAPGRVFLVPCAEAEE